MTTEQLTEMAEARRELAQRLQFSDASLWLGEPEGFPCARPPAPEQLGEAVRSRHLTGGLVSHWWGHTRSPQAGNRALQEAALWQDESLHAIWTGLPTFPAEEGPLPGGSAVPAWVRAVRLFSRTHNFPLEEWCLGGLCSWLVDRRLPLFLWHTEIDWPSLYRLAQAFPELAIVVETQPRKILYHTRPLFALMRACPQVRVELSNFAGAGFVEYAARQFGPERLLFGSFLPVSDPLVPIGMVLDADLPEEAKRLIAGENLRRLVEGVQP